MCSVVNNLVTLLESGPVRCATTLCHFGWAWNGYVATQFILLSSTAESSATSRYVVVPEYFGQNEEPASRNDECATKKPSFLPICGFNRRNMKKHVNMNFIHHLYVLLFNVFYLYFVDIF